jgi:hypothetical protein
MNQVPDNRDPYWKAMEAVIQAQAKEKDSEFILTGPWKQFVRKQDGLSVYCVNGHWMRRNLLASWNHGGHGYVCEFIPLNEIWISDTHPSTCSCLGVNDSREISPRYFESCTLHEITERQLMAEQGLSYWEAHQIAMQTEQEADFLPDGNTEDYAPL